MISARTKAALAASKARGKKLGGFRGRAGTAADTAKARAARTLKATEQARSIEPIIDRLDPAHTASLRNIARALSTEGVPTPSGSGTWTAARCGPAPSEAERRSHLRWLLAALGRRGFAVKAGDQRYYPHKKRPSWYCRVRHLRLPQTLAALPAKSWLLELTTVRTTFPRRRRIHHYYLFTGTAVTLPRRQSCSRGRSRVPAPAGWAIARSLRSDVTRGP